MLSNPAVRNEVSKPHHSTNDVCMQDFCDGSFVKNHALFQNHPQALQLIVYYDDIEVGNPLGSKSGIHKLGTVLHKYTCYNTVSIIHIYLYRVLLLYPWKY